MTDTSIVAQHPPAVKVGGRRLSLSAKHRPHAAPETKPTTEVGNTNNEPDVTDYPRPVAPSSNDPEHLVHANRHHQHHDEELPPKKERKHTSHEKEQALRKAETTRPTRDTHGASFKAPTGGIRIAQPAGKGLGI